jgi:hypothetical protein
MSSQTSSAGNIKKGRSSGWRSVLSLGKKTSGRSRNHAYYTLDIGSSKAQVKIDIGPELKGEERFSAIEKGLRIKKAFENDWRFVPPRSSGGSMDDYVRRWKKYVKQSFRERSHDYVGDFDLQFKDLHEWNAANEHSSVGFMAPFFAEESGFMTFTKDEVSGKSRRSEKRTDHRADRQNAQLWTFSLLLPAG